MAIKRSRRRIIAKFAFTEILVLATSCAWSLELQTVLSNTSVTPPDQVRFREVRYNPLLKEPIVLTGYLEYVEAGWLRKVVETPFEEAFLVGPNQIEIERGGETRKIALNKSKTLLIMLVGMEAILAGQTEKLESIFEYQLSGTEDSWSLQLVPVSRKISRHLARLQVLGNDEAITSIRFELTGGEWHLLEILKADADP